MTVLAVTWWCHTIKAPWSWTPRFYVGVWLVVGALALAYGLAFRHRSQSVGLTAADRRAAVWFACGLAVFWIATDWPVATLGGAYLLSVHVLIYMLYTFAAAPMMLIGTPRWMAERIITSLHAWSIFRALTRPWVAALQLNIILVISHLPPVVDTLRSNQAGSFLLDAAWMVSALLAWCPVASPFRGDRIRQPLYMCAYLFIAFQLFPMLPGSLITFATLPIYRVYELAPRLGSWTPQNDQQLAGALMAIGATPVIWTIIAILFLRAAGESERQHTPSEVSLAEADAIQRERRAEAAARLSP
jgi:putative membrane protein